MRLQRSRGTQGQCSKQSSKFYKSRGILGKELTAQKHRLIAVHSMEEYVTAFGTIEVPRCQARSKRSGEQCRKAAMRDKQVCRTHGGASTGPKTAAGRAKCAEVKMVHGREARAIRAIRDKKLRELRELEGVMKGAGLIT